jgi:predicted ATPase
MLTSFEVRNFKSFAHAKLELRPLTVLIGANASGKTNLIEALQLLAWMAEGRPLPQLLSAIRDAELHLRGTLPELTWDRDEPVIGLGCTVEGDEPIALELELAFDDPLGARVVREQLDQGAVTHYQARWVASGSLIPGPMLEYSARSSTSISVGHTPTSMPVFTLGLNRFIDDDPSALAQVASTLRAVLVIDPSPRVMRGYTHEQDRNLRSDAANVSAVLHHLCNDNRSDAILEFVRALPEQDITALDFIPTPRGEYMVKLCESFGGRERWSEAALLSDGTLRVLAVAAAVLSAPAGSTVVIEEVDNGIHASRVGHLLALIHREAEARNLRVLVTTHNTATLDAIPEDELAHVVACYRDPDQGDSRLVALGELDRYPELLARGSLGQVVAQGILDRLLKQKPEDREAAAKQWLESLRSVVP